MRARLPEPLPAFTRPPLMLHEAAAEIASGAVGLVTSDVFDTVVWRPVSQPHHLFVRLGRQLGATDPHGFALARVRAEHEARVAARVEHGSPECSLAEIWERLPVDGPAAELALEAAALRAHPATVAVLADARARGIPVVLVSDTYFSGAELAGLLTSAGIDVAGLGIEVVTSSDRRRHKWDGLLADVIAEHPGPALHIGDNPFADLVTGDRAGARVAHADLLDADDAALSAHAAWDRLSAAVGSDGGHSAAIRETLLAAGPAGRDPSYQFGVEVAGPVMAGFAGWVSATAEQVGAAAVHCLLREGARIAELIDVVRPSGPRRVLVHASRWAIMRAAVIEGTSNELERALARRAALTAEHVNNAFGVDAALVAKVLGGDTVPHDRRAEAYAALAADADVRGAIVGASAELRRAAMRYLERTLVLDSGPLVFTDIGWGATIQEGLTAILAEAGVTPHVVGLYALLSPPGGIRSGNGADVRGYLPTHGPRGDSSAHAEAATRHPEFLERINTPATGTLLGFTEAGEPVTRPDDHDTIGPSLQLAQRGVLDFATTLAGLALGDSEPGRARQEEWFTGQGPLAATALEALAVTVRSPDQRLATALGTWEHDDVAGTAAEALSNDAFRRWARYANGPDVSQVAMHDVYWVPGVAGADGGALATQIAALNAGAHPDTVAPRSPTGLARVAVFAPGDTLAAAQTEAVPRLGGEGWMLLRFDTVAPGLRSIRIDLTAVSAMVDVADALITVGDDVLADGVDALVGAARWVGGRWVSDRIAAVPAGGHLLVDPATPITGSVRVSVTVAYRAWPADTRPLLPRWRDYTDRAGRTIARRSMRR